MNAKDAQSAQGEAATAFDAKAVTAAIQRGNEAAFELFYDRFYTRLLRLLIVWTRGDEETAREMLQTVMIKLARKMPVFASEGELGAWVTRVARHTLIDHWRRCLPAIRPEDVNATAFLESADETARDSARLTWLEGAVASLDAEDRWLVDQYYFKRRSQQELAVELGKTVKAVESKLARVRQGLRVAWERFGKQGR